VDRQYVTAYAASAIPSAVVTNQGTLYRQNIEDHSWNGPHCEFTANFAKQEKQTGSLNWGFDTTGGTLNIKAALSHIETYPDGNAEHDGALGVNGDDIEGAEIIIPAGKINVSFKHAAGFITLAQAKTLMRNTGKVNSAPFMTFAAGEVLFLGATGNDGSDSEAEIAYQFAVSENLQAQTIAGIANVNKDGWDYLWIEFKSGVDAARPVKTPLSVHVDRVYHRVNLSTLLGFG
jgi:hypothetical protein